MYFNRRAYGLKKENKKVISSTSANKNLTSALTAINDVTVSTVKAISSSTKEVKSLTATAKKLVKQRAALMKKKKRAAAAVNKDSTAADKKMLRDIEKDIASNKKDGAKIKSQKEIVSVELNALKGLAKRATAYSNSINKADVVINKPKKKKRKKKVIKAVEVTPSVQS